MTTVTLKSNQMSDATQENLPKLILKLETLQEQILSSGKQQIEAHEAIYVFDLYCTAILNKTINILAGYISLVRANNFISAAPLVRIHLDTLLRIFAPIVWGGNVDEFARKVIDGKAINKFKNRSGNFLTDGFLVRELSKKDDFNWVTHVYKTGSSFVHFSDKHIFTSAKVEDENSRVVKFVVGAHDEFIPMEEKLGATVYMNRITIGILSFVNSWSAQKRTYPKQTTGSKQP